MDDAERILGRATALGFQHLGVARVQIPSPRAAEFQAWLEARHHGPMTYMENGAAERINPQARMPTARSALVLAMEHNHRRPPDPGGLTGKVARYAWGRDYHNLAGKRLKKLMRQLRAEGVACWGGIDTAPILERAWAEAAGVGFSGKNCVQILPAHGSWMFLGVLFLELELPATQPITRDHCGRCTRCLDACPTGAFLGPHVLDARRCISTWTIESRGPIPEHLRPGIGRWVFGCDVCQEVCPHNVSAPDSPEDDFAPVNAWLDLPWLLGASEEEILARFTGTPLRRPGARGLKRNACVVLGNLGNNEAIPALERVASGQDPLLAEHARWAIARIGM